MRPMRMYQSAGLAVSAAMMSTSGAAAQTTIDSTWNLLTAPWSTTANWSQLGGAARAHHGREDCQPRRLIHPHRSHTTSQNP